jgi:tetratricopeptide (TPR) repeat protein
LTQQDYDSAGGYYFTAFELSKKVLSTGNRLRISCTKAIADLYDQQGMKEKALEFCLEQLSFFEKYLPESHVNIAHISMKIGELYEDNDDEKKIHSLQRATRILLKNVHLEYATTANCLMMIAEYHQKRNAYDRALKYYIKALEIRMKIYPKDHSTILETQSLIDTGENQS